MKKKKKMKAKKMMKKKKKIRKDEGFAEEAKPSSMGRRQVMIAAGIQLCIPPYMC